MPDISQVKKNFSDLKCCVIIPTYNNDRTLEKLIRSVLEYTGDVIIVNDGSTDNTSGILKKFGHLMVISYTRNRGKGYALKKGFSLAIEKSYRYAITIDSDGQHFAEDLPKFLEKAEEHPDSLIVGARDMEQAGIPGTSSFGHKFSVFWFRVETGIRIPDVQSGYRLYPLEKIKEKHFYTSKYEFEVEVLVRSGWHGINITSVPIRVYYAPGEERISHFRKFRDSARVSMLNTILVMMALLWIRPFLFARGLKKKSLKGFIREYVINSKDSNSKLAWSVAVGIFIGISPIYGWQMVVAFGVAHALKLNKFVTLAASNISIPPFLPLILFLCYITGGLVLGMNTNSVRYTSGISLNWVKENLLQFIVGSLVLGILLAIVSGLTTYILLGIFRKRKSIRDNENPVTQL